MAVQQGMRTLLVEAAVLLTLAAVIIAVRRHRLADWYALSRADRRTVRRLIREGGRAPSPELAPYVRRNAERVIAGYDSPRPLLLVTGFVLIGLGWGGTDLARHDWAGLVLAALLVALGPWFLYLRHRYPRQSAVDARHANRSTGPAMS